MAGRVGRGVDGRGGRVVVSARQLAVSGERQGVGVVAVVRRAPRLRLDRAMGRRRADGQPVTARVEQKRTVRLVVRPEARRTRHARHSRVTSAQVVRGIGLFKTLHHYYSLYY